MKRIQTLFGSAEKFVWNPRDVVAIYVTDFTDSLEMRDFSFRPLESQLARE